MKTNLPADRAGLPAASPNLAQEIVEQAIKRYFIKRRSRVPAFVDGTYALAPAIGLHKNALYHDLWRAPLNAALLAPQLGLNLAAYGFRRAGKTVAADWLLSRQVFLKTRVTQEIERRIHVDLLELPYFGNGEPSLKDALAEEILGDPRLPNALGVLEGPWGETENRRLRASLAAQVTRYLNNRAAVDELANTALTAGLGYALMRWSPRLLGLGSGLAPFLLLNAVVAIFSGVVTDPAQRATGLHHHRLIQFLDALEADFLGLNATREIGDHYAARIVAAIDAFADMLNEPQKRPT